MREERNHPSWRQRLTQVKRHADEDDEAEPGIEVGGEEDDGDDDVGNCGEDAEHNVAVETCEG